MGAETEALGDGQPTEDPIAKLRRLAADPEKELVVGEWVVDCNDQATRAGQLCSIDDEVGKVAYSEDAIDLAAHQEQIPVARLVAARLVSQ